MFQKDLKCGDVLFYRDGQSWISKLICWGTNSLYSHVLLYIGKKQCLEADFSGVRLASISEIRCRTGSHDVYRSTWFLPDLAKIAKQIARQNFKYDFIGLLWRTIVCARWKFLAKHTFLITHCSGKYYCSELVHDVYQRAGAIFTDGLLSAETTPASEAQRKDLCFIGNLSSTK